MKRHLGDELRAAREAAGMSQSKLAHEAGLTREYVSILENGHQSPTVATFLAICEATGAKASRLLRRVESR